MWVKCFAIVLGISLSTHVFPGTWVDEDGESVVVFKNTVVEIISMGPYYYFDKVFDSVRNSKEVRLCIGENESKGIASDCFLGHAEAEIRSQGNARVVVFDTFSKFTLQAVENYLKDGNSARVTIDDDDLFAGYTLHKDYKLTEKSQLTLHGASSNINDSKVEEYARSAAKGANIQLRNSPPEDGVTISGKAYAQGKAVFYEFVLAIRPGVEESHLAAWRAGVRSEIVPNACAVLQKDSFFGHGFHFAYRYLDQTGKLLDEFLVNRPACEAL